MGCDLILFWKRQKELISIHAARMGCDADQYIKRQSITFQSTQPAWAATIYAVKFNKDGIISIHAARMGCDSCFASSFCIDANFNPRSPHGLRQGRTGNNQ